MRVLVTGGAGFIGSHVVDAFVAAGHEVSVIDDLSTGNRTQVSSRAKLHIMNILDPGLPELLARLQPSVLCHHAAQMDVRRSVADPLFDARINILGLIHLLEAGRSAGVRRVIFASSGGAVYGEQERFPAAEEHPTRPASPYGVSKLAGEQYLSYYEKSAGISYAALRYANVYGPRQLATGEAGVVAIFTGKLLSGQVPTINGNGKQTRDYVYVGDVVQANLLALTSAASGPVNIGTGRETDVLTLYALLQEFTGSKTTPVYGPAKMGEQLRSSIDSTHAEKTLGWSAATSLEKGLEETVAFYRQRMAS